MSTVINNCIHPSVYGPGPREGICTKCHEQTEDPAYLIEVKKLLTENRKIAALRLLRTNLGLSLKEAMDYVDGLGIVPTPIYARYAHRELLLKRLREDTDAFIAQYGIKPLIPFITNLMVRKP